MFYGSSKNEGSLMNLYCYLCQELLWPHWFVGLFIGSFVSFSWHSSWFLNKSDFHEIWHRCSASQTLLTFETTRTGQAEGQKHHTENP